VYLIDPKVVEHSAKVTARFPESDGAGLQTRRVRETAGGGGRLRGISTAAGGDRT